jgi:hypothetical protein
MPKLPVLVFFICENRKMLKLSILIFLDKKMQKNTKTVNSGIFRYENVKKNVKPISFDIFCM